MPGKLSEDEDKEIVAEAEASQKKGLSARLEAASNKGKMDDETMKRAWDAKKGGGADGEMSRSAGSSKKQAPRSEEDEKKKKEVEAAAEKEKEKKRVEGEHKRNHDLYWQKQQERSR